MYAYTSRRDHRNDDSDTEEQVVFRADSYSHSAAAATATAPLAFSLTPTQTQDDSPTRVISPAVLVATRRKRNRRLLYEQHVSASNTIIPSKLCENYSDAVTKKDDAFASLEAELKLLDEQHDQQQLLRQQQQQQPSGETISLQPTNLPRDVVVAAVPNESPDENSECFDHSETLEAQQPLSTRSETVVKTPSAAASTRSLLDEATSKSILKTSRRFAQNQHHQQHQHDQQYEQEMPPGQQQPQQQKILSNVTKPAKVVHAKSIVGSRPLHWNANRNGYSFPNNRLESLSTFDCKRKAENITETTKNTSRPQTPTFNTPSFSARWQMFHNITPTPPTNNGTNAHNTQCATFTPAFLAKSTPRPLAIHESDPRQDDDVEAIQEDNDERPTTPTIANYGTSISSQPAKKATAHLKNSKKGQSALNHWTKRLRFIRDGQKGDQLRFQSGYYPYSQKPSLDRSDPRNKANSYMDVMLLSDGLSGELEKLIFLSMVHNHVVTYSEQPGQAQGHLAWVCFTFETVSEQNLQVKSSLRIYDPVVLSARNCAFVTVDDDHEHDHANVDYIVCCTQVCERYPDVLPELAYVKAKLV